MGNQDDSLKKHFEAEDIEILLHFFPQGVCAIDLETTGLSPFHDRIVEVGMVKVLADGTVLRWETLIHPGRSIPEEVIKIHHITDQMVENAPPMSEKLSELIEFIDGLPIVAHNAKFDIGHIIIELHRQARPFFSAPVFDSCRLARKAFQMANYRLGTLAKELKIPLVNSHRALDDALACLIVFARGLRRMDERNSLAAARSAAWLFDVSHFSTDKLVVPRELEALHEMVLTRPIINIYYRGGSLKNRYRPIRPLALIPLPQGPSLQALCVLSNLNKAFSLKKIRSLQLLSDHEQAHWEEKVNSSSSGSGTKEETDGQEA